MGVRVMQVMMRSRAPSEKTVREELAPSEQMRGVEVVAETGEDRTLEGPTELRVEVRKDSMEEQGWAVAVAECPG
jgi:hypothetical protein